MRYSISNILVTAFFSATTALSGTLSVAAQENCDCIVGEIGTLSSLAGSVQMSGDYGLSPAETGASLGSGTQVIVGAGSAIVDFGAGCELALLGVNSELTVSQLEAGKLCVRVTSQVVTQPDVNPQIDPASILLSGAAIGGIILLIDEDGSSGGDNPVSN